MKIFKIIKKNRACPAKPWRSRGFVLLFAVVISSIVLAIALGVSNIALKEVNFSTSSKETNDAFFAADTGAECALYWDNGSKVTDTFPKDVASSIFCANAESQITGDALDQGSMFSVLGLGSSGNSCALVTVLRTTDQNGNPITMITSKGYNVADASSGNCFPISNSVERELDVTY